MNWIRRIRMGLGTLLVGSMSVTVLLLLLEGRWQETIPLHLCSISALAAAYLAIRPRQMPLDFLWYLGMPGAALALVFPAPAVSRFQLLLNGSYVLTHLMILVIPAFLMCAGMRPTCGQSQRMMLLMQGIALLACGAIRLLGTDFLFLAAPPAGTPLESLFSLGYPVYCIALETLIMLCIWSMERLLLLMSRLRGQRNDPIG